VTDAAYISFLPMVMRGGIWAVALRGDTGARAADHAASLRYVTPGFFRTLDIPLKKGRDVAEADAQNSLKVAVVSESFARQYFPGEDPIGKRFTIAFFERTIVGVAGDIRVRGLEGPSEPQVYVPYRQIPDGYMSIYAPKDLAIKASTPPARLVPAVRAIIRGADPDEPVSDVRLLSDIVEDETTTRSGQVRVLGAFALVAVLLAGVGIHGLLAFGVSQRMQEFGVRMALGARPGEIAGLVVRRGIRLALAGAVPGVLLAYAAGRAVEALLAGVPPGDPLTFAGVALFAAVMTIAGSLVPALRAFRVNPLEALRAEV
jgi:predicted permease